jgi:metal-responsive CopG/Arc/MetJ family transcriptional regulator
MNQRSIVTGVSIEKELLRELDRRRRVISVKEGRDLPRSTYICQLLREALNRQKGGVSSEKTNL